MKTRTRRSAPRRRIAADATAAAPAPTIEPAPPNPANLDEKGSPITPGCIVEWPSESPARVLYVDGDALIAKPLGSEYDEAERVGLQCCNCIVIDTPDPTGGIPLRRTARAALELCARLGVISDELGFASSNCEPGPRKAGLDKAEEHINAAIDTIRESLLSDFTPAYAAMCELARAIEAEDGTN